MRVCSVALARVHNTLYVWPSNFAGDFNYDRRGPLIGNYPGIRSQRRPNWIIITRHRTSAAAVLSQCSSLNSNNDISYSIQHNIMYIMCSWWPTDDTIIMTWLMTMKISCMVFSVIRHDQVSVFFTYRTDTFLNTISCCFFFLSWRILDSYKAPTHLICTGR